MKGTVPPGTVPELHVPRFSGYAEVSLEAPSVHLVDGFHFYYTDHLNSTRMLDDWDPGQAEVQVDYYFPFGEINQQSGGGEDTHYKFTGYEEDTGIGLDYAKARFYNPGLGRFNTPDPAGQYFSPYTYVGNRPLDYVDPSGLFGIGSILGGIGDFVNWSVGGLFRALQRSNASVQAPIYGNSGQFPSPGLGGLGPFFDRWTFVPAPVGSVGPNGIDPFIGWWMFVKEPGVWGKLFNVLSIKNMMVTQYWIQGNLGWPVLRGYQIANGIDFNNLGYLLLQDIVAGADVVSTGANTVALLGTVTGQPQIAGPAFAAGRVADIVSLGGNFVLNQAGFVNDDALIKQGTVTFATEVLSRTTFGKVVFNPISKRYISRSTGRFVTNVTGREVALGQGLLNSLSAQLKY